MRPFLVIVAAFAAVSFSGPDACAAEIKVEKFGAGEPSIIEISGGIEVGDADRFSAAIEGVEKAMVLLSSTGGAVNDGLSIAAEIRSMGYDSQTRSRMMAGIRGKDTKPEMALRRSLHASGFRYRLHAKGIPGKPDIVMPKHKAVIFVHGCFWHRHRECRYTTTPTTRPDFWLAKFEANVQRDEVVRRALRHAGWRVATIWECALRTEAAVAAARDILVDWLLTVASSWNWVKQIHRSDHALWPAGGGVSETLCI